MSYRGRPSKGCDGCRARKVKCDETKPACTRCIKTGLECRYRDQANLLFRNQTAAAAQRAEDSWRKRSKSHQRIQGKVVDDENADPSQSSNSQKRTSQRKPSGLRGNDQVSNGVRVATSGDARADHNAPVPGFESPTIASLHNPDIRLVAYHRFLYDFVTPESPEKPPEEPSDALLTFVPLLYQHAAPDSCLATIVNAVCYINFSNRCKVPQARALAEESFGKAIKLLSKMIADEEQAASNDALASVYLMGVYENLSSFQRRGTFVAHQHGANALLQLRTVEQYYSNSVSARLYEVAYAQMLLANLQAAKHPPIPVENVVSVRKYLPSLYNQSNTFVIRLVWREAQLHARWQDMKQSGTPPSSRSDLQQIQQTAFDLDAEFHAWEATLPPAWGYEAQPNTPKARSGFDLKWQKLILGSNGAPREIHSYPNLKRTWIWGFYRTSRMFLLRDTLEMLNWMFRLPEPEQSTYHVGMDSAHNSETLEPGTANKSISPLKDSALRARHLLATNRLIEIIEQSCSAVLGSFTVAVHGKSFEDVSGMRGYVVLWPIGTMDSILSAGLVPDMTNTLTLSDSNYANVADSSHIHAVPPVVSGPVQSFYHDTSMATAANGAVYNQLMPVAPQHRHSVSLPIPAPQVHAHAPVYDISAAKGHIFDCHPRHPYDDPVEIPALNFNITKPRSINVPARREWLNRMLYYIGTELGIKKALAVPFMEGYYQIVKAQVDSILGR